MATPEIPEIKEIAQTDQTYDMLFKVLLVGNTGVGKSSLFLRFVDKIWNDAFVPTIGVDFKIKTLNINNKNIKLQIWDTAGQERFRTIISSYYKGAHGILLIFDLTQSESFDSLKNWLIEIEKNSNQNVVKLLIENKCDLEDKRVISYEKGKDFAEQYNMKYIETSAKNNINVVDAFRTLGMELIISSKDDQFSQGKEVKNIVLNNNIDLNKKKHKINCCNQK